MTVTIRPRREEDIPALADVLVRVHELDGYPVEGVADPEGWLRHPNELESWVAIQNDQLIGQVTLTRAAQSDDAAIAWQAQTGDDTYRLAIPIRLFVDPASRGSGAGRLLMEAALSYAATKELAVAFDVMLKDEAAIRLYEKLGAVRISSLSHVYGREKTEPAAIYMMGR
jgi:GNAT superfamily N-acetyltransferase